LPRRVVILGSTGSVGVQALDVVRRSEGELQVVALSAGHNWPLLLEQARTFDVEQVALSDLDAAARASEAWTDGQVLRGPDGIVQLVTGAAPDIVLNAIVGSAGLLATVATVGEGIDLALANKESLVVGGELVGELMAATGAHIVPVDSEHSALFQLLSGRPRDTVRGLVITASGGPFRGWHRAELEGVTVAQALAHPTWSMGGKITIDSATLMNKGLEVIEAHHLFGLPYEQIKVVVHPQSLIHGLVALEDGAMLAHLGYPDMRVPIAFALHYPRRAPLPIGSLDLVAAGSLTFEEPDLETFRCLKLAREAGIAGGTAPCVLNAANEVAVHAFLAGRLAFTEIAEVVERTLDECPSGPATSFEALMTADTEARERAGAICSDIGLPD